MSYKKQMLSFILCLSLLFSLTGTLIIPVFASTPFTDISDASTVDYVEAIEYVYDKGIMNGINDTQFNPDGKFTRAMMVTTLYRISGSIEEYDPQGFTDVPEGKYYYYAVGWAQHHGIATGMTDTEFSPHTNVTNEQVVTFLYRYVTAYEDKTPILLDNNLIGDYYQEGAYHSYASAAINWALNCDVLNPARFTVYPRSDSLRKECADFLYRFVTLVVGNARAFSMTDTSTTTTTYISDYMNDMGYVADYKYDLTANNMEYAFYNHSLIYSHSHGFTDKTGLSLETSFQSSAIDANKMQNAELVYVSACYSAEGFCDTLYQVGNAQCVVGFHNTIRANDDSNGSNGILKFNQYVFQFLRHGNSLQDSIDMAMSYFSTSNQEYYGMSYIEVYGDYYH